MLSEFTKRLQMLTRQQLAVGAALLTLAGAALYGLVHISGATQGHSEVSSQSRKGLQRYTPTPAEWASLTIQPVTERAFRDERSMRIARRRCFRLMQAVSPNCLPGPATALRKASRYL